MSNVEINMDRRHRVGGLPEPPKNDFEIALAEDDDGFATFVLEFREFDKFAEFNEDTRVCVKLKKKKQKALFVCGLLKDFSKNGYFSLEQQKKNGAYRNTEQTIVGIPSSAEVNFVSPTGRKLYRWVKRPQGTKREGTKRGRTKTRNQKGVASIINHVETKDDDMGSVMSINFEEDNGKIEVIWNHHLFYDDITEKEKLLISQKIMGELVNYLILMHLTGEEVVLDDIDPNDFSSPSIIKQFLLHLNQDALNIFNQDRNVSARDYLAWKQWIIDTYCEKVGILKKLEEELAKK